MKARNIILFALGCLALCSCEENDIALYDEPARIEFGGNTSYVFSDREYLKAYVHEEGAPVNEADAYAEVEVTSRLIGYLLESPLTYCLKSQPVELTPFHPEVAFEPQYAFPVEAAECQTVVRVKCPSKENVSTQDETFYGLVDILYDGENEAHQFGEGRVENKASRISVALQIYPGDWDYVFWGAYSTSKYFLIMETFKAVHDDIEPTVDNKLEILKAYRSYKAENGPLYGDGDDSNEEIQFPA